jgi:hypothetical protein
MSKEELLFEDFDLWLKTKFTDTFRLTGHKFEKSNRDDILVDGGLFTKEEVKELFRMLISRNPFLRFNATIVIWERNGVLIKIIIALALFALILVYFWISS